MEETPIAAADISTLQKRTIRQAQPGRAQAARITFTAWVGLQRHAFDVYHQHRFIRAEDGFGYGQGNPAAGHNHRLRQDAYGCAPIHQADSGNKAEQALHRLGNGRNTDRSHGENQHSDQDNQRQAYPS